MPMSYPSGHPEPDIAALIAVLQRWADGIANGEARSWYPDPHYVWRTSKPTQDKIDEVFAAIKSRFDLEVPRVAKRDGLGLAEAGPDFESLGPAQREAMCQELDAVIRAVDAAHEIEITEQDIAW